LKNAAPLRLKYVKCSPNFKYQSRNKIAVNIPELKDCEASLRDIKLTKGVLHINAYKYWDGTSGPTIDTAKSKVPSLVHDCLCELIESGALDKKHLPLCDIVFYRLCRERKMMWLKARLWFQGLKIFSKFFVKRRNPKVYVAH